MTNGLDVARRAVDLWGEHSTRNKESAYGSCQSFEGYYMAWAARGTESGIAVYPSATAALHASDIYSRDINAAQPGDQLFWEYGANGHVCTAVGYDGGRVLVTNTANGGDTVAVIGRNVKVCHADTIPLKFLGVSAANGKGQSLRGTFDAYRINDAPAPPPPATRTFRTSSVGAYWYRSAADANRLMNVHGNGMGGKAGRAYTNEPMLYGEYPVVEETGAAFSVRANDGEVVWVSGKLAGNIR